MMLPMLMLMKKVPMHLGEEKEGSNFIYEWIYELNLVEGKWLIKGYKEK